MHSTETTSDEGGASAHTSEVRCPAHSCPHPSACATAEKVHRDLMRDVALGVIRASEHPCHLVLKDGGGPQAQ